MRRIACLIFVSVISFFGSLGVVHAQSISSEPFFVELPVALLDAHTWSSKEERTEQIRDWLLYAAIEITDASQDDVALALYTLPPLRLSELAAAADYQNGETRWAIVGEDLVVVVPRDAEDLLVGAAVDQYRMTTTHCPHRIAVFEYGITLPSESVSLEFDGWRFGEAYFQSGRHAYYEVEVDGLSDLESFLSKGVDLTYADVSPDGILTLGGRSGGDKPLLATEDLAVICQAQQDRFHLSQDVRQQYRNLDPGLQSELLGFYGIDEDVLDSILSPPLGFSLDPFDSWTYYELMSLSPTGVSDTRWEDICEAIARGDLYGGIAETVLYWESSEDELRDLVDALEWLLLYSPDCQCPRYDGAIEGTEVAMTWYYCDLLMKLWGFDYESSTPEIIGMDAVPEIAVPSAEWGPCWDYPSTRLWLGPRWEELGHSSHELFFSSVGVRAYAASSDDTSWGEEVEPNPENRRFIAWWESHWEDIMAYEPQYRRLNQLMKWSTLISWLALEGHTALSGLVTVEADRDLGFRTWVIERRGELTCGGDLPFVDACKGECIERLVSRTYWSCGFDTAYLKGGVSPTSTEELAEMLASGLLTSDVWRNITEIRIVGRGDTSVLNGTVHAIDLSQLSIVSTPTPRLSEVYFSGDWAEWQEAESLKLQFAQGADGLRVSVDLGVASLGLFSTTHEGRRVVINHEPTPSFVAQDIVESLAQQLTSETMQLSYPLLRHISQRTDITAIYQLSDGSVLAETVAGEWIHVGEAVEGNIRSGISDKNSLVSYIFAAAVVDQAHAASLLGPDELHLNEELAERVAPHLREAESALSLSSGRIAFVRPDGMLICFPFDTDALSSQDEVQIALQLLDPSEPDIDSLQPVEEVLDVVASTLSGPLDVVFVESRTGKSAAEYRAIDQYVKLAKWRTPGSRWANLAVVYDQPSLEETVEGLQEASSPSVTSTAVLLHGCDSFSEWLDDVMRLGVTVLTEPNASIYEMVFSDPRYDYFIIVAGVSSNVPLAAHPDILSDVGSEHIAISLLVPNSWDLVSSAITYPEVELVFYMDGALRMTDAIEVAYRQIAALEVEKTLHEAAMNAWLNTLAAHSGEDLRFLLMEFFRLAAKA